MSLQGGGSSGSLLNFGTSASRSPAASASTAVASTARRDAFVSGGAQFLSTVASAQATKREGRFEEKESELAARREELGAVQREGDRKRRLAEALASQNASAGAKGIKSFEGSPFNILQEDIKKEEVATERDIFNTRAGALQKRISGSAAKSRSKFKAKDSLIDGLLTLKADFNKFRATADAGE